METCKQPTEYFMIEYGFNGEVIIETFRSSIPEHMEQPDVHGMTWEQVQKTLNKHYSDISKSYKDISDDWLDKACNEYFTIPKTNQEQLWDDDEW